MTAAALALPEWHGRSDDAARVIDSIDSWVASDALASVVHVFGGRLGNRTGDTALDYLDRFSAEHWDFRRGRERDALVGGGLDRSTADAVIAAAASLGQADRTTPHHRSYDAIVLTGGMVRAGLVKPRFVASLLDGGVSATEVVFLGAHRPFSAAEAQLAGHLDVAGDDEVDAMVEGMVRAFGLSRDGATRSAGGAGSAAWSATEWITADRRYRVVAAPSIDPDRRADTATTFRHWGASLAPGSRVLVVTTPVYVPYQAAVAVETLGLGAGLGVDTVGTDAAANDLGEYTQVFLAAHHLQELRSAVRAMRSLRSLAESRTRSSAPPGLSSR